MTTTSAPAPADQIGGLPFWHLTFDAQGDCDRTAADAVLDAVRAGGVTDLVLFSHGWNNDLTTADRLYSGWFGQLAPQLQHAVTDRPVSVGLVGVFWPSQRWSDEPIPDFAHVATGGADGADAGDAAAVLDPPAGEGVDAPIATSTLEPATLTALQTSFPAGAAQLDAMAALLAQLPSDAGATALLTLMRQFAAATAVPHDDGVGESVPVASNGDPAADPGGDPGGDGSRGGAAAAPRMLQDDAADLFGRYAAALRDSGLAFPEQSSGEASIGDVAHGLWEGAKEALRQLTYWQMKNRAGLVGQQGLGPWLGRLAEAAPDVRVHLVGHSFGARLVCYALAGLPSGLDPSPVKAVTLLQGAFSHFAFADPLPVDAGRKGALAGRLSRIDGPLTVCFSSYDGAVGRFYPLASIASGDDSSAVDDRLYRWGGMGHDGAQGVAAAGQPLGGVGPGVAYPFVAGGVLNLDASQVVCHGSTPAGAHSDIVHPELTWVVLSAGRIVA